MAARFWRRVDDLSHWLGRTRLGFKLLPGWVSRAVCDRYEHALGLSWADVLASWNAAEKHVTAPPKEEEKSA